MRRDPTCGGIVGTEVSMLEREEKVATRKRWVLNY
jgi:hypothetical protein